VEISDKQAFKLVISVMSRAKESSLSQHYCAIRFLDTCIDILDLFKKDEFLQKVKEELEEKRFADQAWIEGKYSKLLENYLDNLIEYYQERYSSRQARAD